MKFLKYITMDRGTGVMHLPSASPVHTEEEVCLSAIQSLNYKTG